MFIPQVGLSSSCASKVNSWVQSIGNIFRGHHSSLPFCFITQIGYTYPHLYSCFFPVLEQKKRFHTTRLPRRIGMYILQITTLKTILAFHQLIDNPNNHGYSDPIPDHSIAFLMEEERTRQCEGRKKDKTCRL